MQRCCDQECRAQQDAMNSTGCAAAIVFFRPQSRGLKQGQTDQALLIGIPTALSVISLFSSGQPKRTTMMISALRYFLLFLLVLSSLEASFSKSILTFFAVQKRFVSFNH
jgi:hypothetical protein